MPGETSIGPNLATPLQREPLLPSPRPLVSPHPLPSPRPLPSERSHRATPFLKLPPLQELVETGETGNEVLQRGVTPQSLSERLPPYHAYTLLKRYDSLLPSDKLTLAVPDLLPEIKLSIRTTMARNTARSRFTTLSLEKMEQQGKLLFTEGISSSSRRPEPSFFIQRRDIIGANMPDTVKLSRDRSKVTFGLRNSNAQGSRAFNDLFPTSRPVNTFGLEATDGLTALSKAASNRSRRRHPREEGGPPATPQESMFDLIRRESRTKADMHRCSPTPRPHPVPDNTPRAGVGDGRKEPSTILIPRLDSPSCSSHPAPLAALSERPRESPKERKDERPCRSSLSVVSLGDALSIDQEYNKTPIRALHASFDFRPAREKNKGWEKEGSRSSRHEPAVTNFELPIDNALDQRTVIYSKRPGQLRDDISLRNRKGGHPRNRLRTKWDSQLTVADSGFHEPDIPENREGASSDCLTSGWDKDLKVKALRSCPREGSATSSSVPAPTNPPPSVAATSMAEDETRTVGPLSSHPAMFTVPEERSAPTTSRLVNSTATPHLLSDSEQISNASVSHLPVPKAGDLKEEGRPPFPNGGPPEVSSSDSARSIAIQTSPPFHQKNFSARSVRVKTLELFPSSSNAFNGFRTPSISVVSDTDVEKEDEQQRTHGSKSSEDGDPERKPSAGSLSIRNKTIKFISPLETQDNAKRQ